MCGDINNRKTNKDGRTEGTEGFTFSYSLTPNVTNVVLMIKTNREQFNRTKNFLLLCWFVRSVLKFINKLAASKPSSVHQLGPVNAEDRQKQQRSERSGSAWRQ